LVLGEEFKELRENFEPTDYSEYLKKDKDKKKLPDPDPDQNFCCNKNPPSHTLMRK
jgi:hypothetical protein